MGDFKGRKEAAGTLLLTHTNCGSADLPHWWEAAAGPAIVPFFLESFVSFSDCVCMLSFVTKTPVSASYSCHQGTEVTRNHMTFSVYCGGILAHAWGSSLFITSLPDYLPDPRISSSSTDKEAAALRRQLIKLPD